MELSLSACTTASWRRSSSASGRARSSSTVSWWLRSEDCGLFSLSDPGLILRTASTKGALLCALCVCLQVLACPYKDNTVEFCSQSYSPKCLEEKFSEVHTPYNLGPTP